MRTFALKLLTLGEYRGRTQVMWYSKKRDFAFSITPPKLWGHINYTPYWRYKTILSLWNGPRQRSKKVLRGPCTPSATTSAIACVFVSSAFHTPGIFLSYQLSSCSRVAREMATISTEAAVNQLQQMFTDFDKGTLAAVLQVSMLCF